MNHGLAVGVVDDNPESLDRHLPPGKGSPTVFRAKVNSL
jgi:hypothetical protein